MPTDDDQYMLDLTDLSCPWTIIETKQAMSKLAKGNKLLINFKDPSFIIDCKVYIQRTGCELIAQWQERDYMCFLLQK